MEEKYIRKGNQKPFTAETPKALRKAREKKL
jgi:hypothetical protein